MDRWGLPSRSHTLGAGALYLSTTTLQPIFYRGLADYLFCSGCSTDLTVASEEGSQVVYWGDLTNENTSPDQKESDLPRTVLSRFQVRIEARFWSRFWLFEQSPFLIMAASCIQKTESWVTNSSICNVCASTFGFFNERLENRNFLQLFQIVDFHYIHNEH